MSNESPFIRVVREVRIKAPAAKVFPLACPVEEYKWIPGWKCRLVQCPNDRVEEGTVFQEATSAPFILGRHWGWTTWTAVLHDPVGHRVHYRLENALSRSLYRIEMEDDGAGGTTARLDIEYTPLTSRGRGVAARPERIAQMLDLLGLMLRTYCETGRRVRAREVRQAVLSSPVLLTMDRLRLALNGVRMGRLQDPDRDRILATWARTS